MVGVSFYLSYLIWMSPVSRDSMLQKESDFETIEEKVQTVDKEEVFLPLKVRYEDAGKNLETQNENLLKQLQATMRHKQFTATTWRSYQSEAEYVDAINVDNGLELTYGMIFPLDEYVRLFQLDLELSEEEQVHVYFTKIQIDIEGNKIRFINDEDWTVFAATPDIPLGRARELIETLDYQWREVSDSIEMLPNRFFTQEALTLKKYSYISSTRRYTLFRDAFFTNPKDVRNNVTAADTYFYDGVESLTMKQNKDNVVFQSLLNKTAGKNILDMSFPYVQKMGTSYGSIRILNQARNTIDYRMFVEGFPIFSQDYEGQLLFDFSDNAQSSQKNVHIQGNLKTLQIPVPSKENVVLPATQDLVEELYRKGADLKQIRTFLIGYEWRNLENTGVVDLIPNWFVKYGDNWFSYEALAKQLAEKKEE